jgi:hypothetical protein
VDEYLTDPDEALYDAQEAPYEAPRDRAPLVPPAPSPARLAVIALEGEPKPSEPRSYPCSRCSRLADVAARAGEPVPSIAQAETVVVDGRRYARSCCRFCADYEFSERWIRDSEAALSLPQGKVRDELLKALDERRQRWTKLGRRMIPMTGRRG